MKGSKELIEHYNKRKEELGEKATKLNMYLEGYAEGHKDTKADMIDKICEWFADYLMEIGYPDDWMRDSPNIESGEMRFRKAMEEYI